MKAPRIFALICLAMVLLFSTLIASDSEDDGLVAVNDAFYPRASHGRYHYRYVRPARPIYAAAPYNPYLANPRNTFYYNYPYGGYYNHKFGPTQTYFLYDNNYYIRPGSPIHGMR